MWITLPDGAKREFESGMTALEIAGKLSQGLKKSALAVQIDGKVRDLTTVISDDCTLSFLTFQDDEGKRVLRHTASHVMAQAVKKIRPEAKLAIGPAIDNGFYYDFDVEETFSPEDITAIEKEMARIIKQNLKLERFELPRNEAIALMRPDLRAYSSV